MRFPSRLLAAEIALFTLTPLDALAQQSIGPVTARPGQTVRLYFHYQLDRDCTPIDYPEPRIEVAPSQGRLSTRKIQERPSFTPTSLYHHCNARPVWGTEIRYTANATAAGEDLARVLMVYGGHTHNVIYRVVIQPTR